METLELARRFSPEITFSKDEQYFPCPMFFAGKEIVNNKRRYDRCSEEEKRRLISCYYHVVEHELLTAIEYWYYYAYNDYRGPYTAGIPDEHDHDMEFAIVYLHTALDPPTISSLCLNQHHWRNWVWAPRKPELQIYAEKGGHGMFREKKPFDVWEPGGLTIKVEPTESVESLRQSFLSPEPENLIDPDGTIKGEANLMGRPAKPKVPWVRVPEYTLPISAVYSNGQEHVDQVCGKSTSRELLSVREVNFTVPYAAPTKIENLKEALRLQLITKDQFDELSGSEA